jgi:rSAM/selenodomain-associated transferase 1
MKESALIIFQKKPELGKVKTRLANTIGDEKALEVYQCLLDHTHREAALLGVPTFVFFEKEEQPEYLVNNNYHSAIQASGNLGEKMKAAFTKVFELGYERVVIVGTDCLELDVETLYQAFQSLETNEVVLGPAKDGGYYLLGMKRLYRRLFENKNWSTPTVLSDTVTDIRDLGLNLYLLKELTDVDVYQDLSTELKDILEIKGLQ